MNGLLKKIEDALLFYDPNKDYADGGLDVMVGLSHHELKTIRAVLEQIDAEDINGELLAALKRAEKFIDRLLLQGAWSQQEAEEISVTSNAAITNAENVAKDKTHG